MRAFVLGIFVLSVFVVATEGTPAAQPSLTKRDQQGPVTVVVTLIPPATPGAPLKAKVTLDTHSVGLDGIALDRAVVMRAGATEVPPTAVEEPTGGGHHRGAVLVFSAPAQPGPVHIVVKDVGGVAERTFSWELPPAP